MALNYSSIPEDLKKLPQWVVHRDKIPHNPGTGYRASVTDPATWGTFEDACSAANTGSFSGIGFVFTESDPFVGVDFDHCITDGQLNPWVKQQLGKLESYTELSPSGTGLHVICRGKLPGKAVKTSQAEIYDRSRYFTFTGNTYGVPRSVSAAESGLSELYKELSPKKEDPKTEHARPQRTPVQLTDLELIEKASSAHNGERFKALYSGDLREYAGDHSRADMALSNLLAYWTNGDIDRMDRLFRQSGLMRDKWDRRQSGSTYGMIQLEKAVADMQQGYDPEQYRLQQTLQAFSDEPRPANGGLAVINAADLAAKYLPPVRFFVEGLLPQGLALLSAPPKYGKSWFVLDLCLAVARGIPFLDRETYSCGCLYLALEDSENRLKSRMLTLLPGYEIPRNFSFCLAAPDLANGLIDQLESFLQANPDTGMIVIDTLQKVRGPSSRSEGAYKYDYREMTLIKKFADKHGILVLVVHHLRKMADDSDPHNRISGTNGIMGAADTSLVLSRAKRTDSETTLSVTGRDVDSEDLVLKFDKDSCRWKVEGTPEDMQRESAKRKYLAKPLVQVIRSLVFQNNGKWRGRMKALNEASATILGDQLLENNELRKYPGMLKAIREDLEFYDGITYHRHGNGTSNGSGEYEFSASVWEDFHTEQDRDYYAD